MSQFTISSDPFSKDLLLINNNDEIKDCQFISFGINKRKINIHVEPNLEKNHLILSQNIIEDFQIPLHSIYEIVADDTSVIIGPFIGILTHLTETGHTRLKNDIKSYVKNYPEIRGVIVSFSLESVDLDQHVISTGVIYNPLLQCWEEQINIPLPAVIFNKCRVSHSDKWEYIASLYGPKIFNFPTFDKWDMYNWFSQDPQLMTTLPHTIVCKKPYDVWKFLKTYQIAYLKPIIGTFARGVIKITHTGTSIFVRYERKKQTIFQFLDSKKAFNRFFNRLFRKQDFLIQEAIDLIELDERIIDFRKIYIKNEQAEWVSLGLFARFGKTGSAVSNLTAGGKGLEGDSVLSRFFATDIINDIKEQMEMICHQAAVILEEKLIQCGNLGFDFGIDKHGKVWVIEVNNEDPDHRIALVCKRKEVLYKARLQNMLYAKHLAGFHKIHRRRISG